MTKTTLALPLALVALGLLPGFLVTAQDGPAERPARDESGRYFSRPLDLWKAGLSFGPAPEASSPAGLQPSRVALRESVWAQPIRTPDGSWMIYVPPRQVLDFLESPSEETAKAYLRWKEDQADKLRKAMALLAKVKDPPLPTRTPDGLPPASAAPLPSMSHEKIIYFKRPDCPHCVTQDAVLAEWLKRKPGLTLDIVLTADRPELWKAYGVRGTPTLVVQGERPDHQETLVGSQSAEALDAALGRLAAVPEDGGARSRKETPR